MQLTSAKVYMRLRKGLDFYTDNENIQINKRHQCLQSTISFLRAQTDLWQIDVGKASSGQAAL